MATGTRRPRHCNYCPDLGADVCVRMQTAAQGGAHIYAHRACAEQRGQTPLFVFTEEQPVGVAR